MDLKLNVPSSEKLRRAEGIPLHYIPEVSGFAKPKLLTSSYVDILFQETYGSGYTLRSYFFHVHQPVTLVASLSSPKLCIANIFSGEITFCINGQEEYAIQKGKYGVLHLNTDEHLLSFQPGKHEMLRCDFNLEKLQKYGAPYSTAEHWLKRIGDGYSVLLDKGHIDDTMQALTADIKRLSPSEYEEDRAFYKKYREILRHVLGQQDLLHTEN